MKRLRREVMQEIIITTRQRTEFIDITSRVISALKEAGGKSGVCIIYVPHTTASVTINENADPTVCKDILAGLERIAPHKGEYRHREGNADAHIKASIVGSSVMVMVEKGELQMGTWQGIFLCEFDGPRSRRVWIKWLVCPTAAA
jgi:secondary thiamine-phosphate synthase enzyme